jgi:phospholipase/carboxylesterase
MHKKEIQINDIHCCIYQHEIPDTKVRSVVVFLHGYCGSGEFLAQRLIVDCGLQFQEEVAAIFPQAPILIDNDKWAKNGDSAWWKYDRSRLDEFEFQKRPLLEIDEEMPGLDQATVTIKEMVAKTKREIYPNLQRVMFAGFSQGAILATDLGLDSGVECAALGVFSGTLTKKKKWIEAIKKLPKGKIEIIQSHGKKDHILNIDQARELKVAFEAAGHIIFYYENEAGHALNIGAVQKFGEVIKRNATV